MLADAAVETLTREQQRTTELLGEVMSLLTTIASDMAALRATSRVVVDVEGSPPRCRTAGAHRVTAEMAKRRHRPTYI